MTAIGYARVDPGHPMDELGDMFTELRDGADCVEVLYDCGDGFPNDNPGLTAALLRLEQGDTLLIPKIASLTCSCWQLSFLLDHFEASDVTLTSLRERASTVGEGRFMFSVRTAYTAHELEAAETSDARAERRQREQRWHDNIKRTLAADASRRNLLREIATLEAREKEAREVLSELERGDADDHGVAKHLRKGIAGFGPKLTDLRQQLAALP